MTLTVLLAFLTGLAATLVARQLCTLADAIDAPYRRRVERDTARRAATAYPAPPGGVDRGVLKTIGLIVAVALVGLWAVIRYTLR